MKLESQVCNLELSRKLKEFNCPQDSLFYWIETLDGHGVFSKMEAEKIPLSENEFPAYTASELGEMLLEPIYFSKTPDGYNAQFRYGAGEYPTSTSDTLANAMAKMLCYLLENSLIKL